MCNRNKLKVQVAVEEISSHNSISLMLPVDDKLATFLLLSKVIMVCHRTWSLAPIMFLIYVDSHEDSTFIHDNISEGKDIKRDNSSCAYGDKDEFKKYRCKFFQNSIILNLFF